MFVLGYVVQVLEDATVYKEHAGKLKMDVDDIRLATQTHTSNSAIPKAAMKAISLHCNSIPLPEPSEKLGVRIPNEKYCLTAANYQIPIPENSEDEEEKSDVMMTDTMTTNTSTNAMDMQY